jgi:hypothetical protein
VTGEQRDGLDEARLRFGYWTTPMSLSTSASTLGTREMTTPTPRLGLDHSLAISRSCCRAGRAEP